MPSGGAPATKNHVTQPLVVNTNISSNHLSCCEWLIGNAVIGRQSVVSGRPAAAAVRQRRSTSAASDWEGLPPVLVHLLGRARCSSCCAAHKLSWCRRHGAGAPANRRSCLWLSQLWLTQWVYDVASWTGSIEESACFIYNIFFWTEKIMCVVPFQLTFKVFQSLVVRDHFLLVGGGISSLR